MSKGNIIMIRANREYNVILPGANDVASMFGHSSLPTYFAIYVRIMIHPDTSGVTISGYFRPNNVVNQSVYLHPGNSMGFQLLIILVLDGQKQIMQDNNFKQYLL